MGVIKATSTPPSVSVFSLRDVEEQAKGLIIRARERSELIVAAAQEEAERIKRDARLEGFAQGRTEGLTKGSQEGTAEGRQRAHAEHSAALEELSRVLTLLVEQLDRSRQELEAAATREVLGLAVAIAERVTKRQGVLDPRVAVANVSEALKLVIHGSDVRIVVHPEQKSVLEEALPALKAQWSGLKHVELIEDETLTPGGCRLYTAQGEIDGDLDGQLRRIVADLLPDTTAGGSHQ
jgi:flagellar assembly protein FliH